MTNAPRALRVLVVAHDEPWPLDSGGRLHVHHLVRELARRTQVTLLLPQPARSRSRLPRGIEVESAHRRPGTADADDTPPVPPPSLFERLAARHFGLPRNLATWLQRHARRPRFDAVILHSAVYGLLARFCAVPVIWNPQDELVLATLSDAAYSGWRTWPRALRRAALYALYERTILRRVAATVFVSPVDSSVARRCAGRARIVSIPNGVDCEYFRPADKVAEAGTVVFIGALDFPPNVDAATFFATHVWPTLHARNPNRRFVIVGRNPVASVRRLGRQPGIRLAADVPDVRPYLARAAVVVVPTRKGGGMKNKVLEACAARRPVVSSSRALAGLTARIGRDIACAERPADWVAQVERLLEQPDEAARLADQGHTWVRTAHRWSDLGARFHEILREVVPPAARHPSLEPRTEPRPETAARVMRRPTPAPAQVAEEVVPPCR